MLKEVYCPYCGKKMGPFGSSRTIVTCREHGIMFVRSDKVYKAELMDNAPEFMKESKEFFTIFKELKPTFVLSPTLPHEEGFTVKDCVYVDCPKVHDWMICKSIPQLLLKSDIVDKHLIAGQGYLATDIRETFYAGIYLHTQDNPLRSIVTEDYESYLARTITLYNVRKQDKSSSTDDLLNLYGQPTLEGMVNSILHCFSNESISHLTDEQLLYSHIFAMPEINIGWGKTETEVKKAIYSYICACLSDIDAVSIDDNVDTDYMNNIYTTEQSLSSFKDAFYSAQISTAVNNIDGKKISFDVLENKFNHDYAGYYDPQTLNVNSAQILFRTYQVLGELFKKYAGEQFKYGLQAKHQYLSSKGIAICTYEEVVLDFWKLIKKRMERELEKL